MDRKKVLASFVESDKKVGVSERRSSRRVREGICNSLIAHSVSSGSSSTRTGWERLQSGESRPASHGPENGRLPYWKSAQGPFKTKN